MTDTNKRGKSCTTCAHRCMDMDLDPYCSAVNKPYGHTLSRSVPHECGDERKLWEPDERRRTKA